MCNIRIVFLNGKWEYTPNRLIAAYVLNKSVRLKTAMLFVKYLRLYLMEFNELQYSLLQSALNILERSSEHRAIQELSTTKSFPFTWTVIVLPSSSDDRRWYSV